MMTILLAAVGALTAATGELPDALKFLEPLATDEKALVDAMRDYDKKERALADAEIEAAKTAAMDGKQDEARQKQESARARCQLIRKGYEYVLQQYANNARARNYYAELLYDQFGEHAAAIRAWHEAIAIEPRFSPPYNNLAIHYSHFGDYRKALEYYDQAIELDPENPDYLFNLAQMYLVNFPQVQEIRKWKKAKVYREAIKLSKKAAALAPDDFELAQDYAVNFFAAENFGVKADWAEAARAWQRARALARSADEVFFTWLNEGRVWIRAGNKEKAAACLKEAMAIRPKDGVAQRLLDELDDADAGPKAIGHARKSKSSDGSGR